MSTRKSSVFLAVVASCGLAPLAVQAAPSVSITAPAAGATVSGTISGAACEAIASASGGVKRVRFFVDSTAGALGTSDTSAPYRCTLDTTKLSNGAHQLIARAFDMKGVMGSKTIAINVQNGTGGGTTSGGSTPAPEAGPLDVWFKAPADGATLSGTLAGGTSCYVKGLGVTKVQFFVDGTSVGTDSTMADGMQCQIDTTKFANGAHQLKATASDASGATRNDVINITIANSGTTTGGGTTGGGTTGGGTTGGGTTGGGTGTGGGTTTGANGLKAVSTFHSIGLYWTPPSSPGAAGCTVQYRKQGAAAYQPGFAMWYDSRNKECRGSLVQLDPGANYDIQVGMPGQTPAASVTAKTWDEQFPIAQTITVNGQTGTLNITQSGTATGYIVYQAAPGAVIDGGSAAAAISINASYVIVRGFTVKGGNNGIQIQPGQHDVIVEQNDVSAWGRLNYTNSSGWKIGVDEDSGITAKCYNATGAYRMIIQRNKVHDPKYGANSWDWGHPAGPTGISFYECGDNNVVRYNEVTSANEQHYYNDAIGGGNNDSNKGSPGADSDIYGNIASNSMDDGIEAEGGGRNVRVWGNYVDTAAVGIATTPVSIGPIYVFRNVYNRSRQLYLKALDSDERNNAFKSGSWSACCGFGDGRRYVFHNTVLQQAATSGAQYTLGAGGGISASGSDEPLTNTVSRNNILHIFKDWWSSFAAPASGNDLDYDLYNGGNEVGGTQSHGKVGVPVYATGNGAPSGSGGMYQLAPASPGYGAGIALPNFNSQYAKPDMGAHQSGTAAMKFGVNAQ